mgnify:CR=1 FL=1
MPDLLPPAEWPSYIAADVVGDVTDRIVDRAERTIIERYREIDACCKPDYIDDYFNGDLSRGTVQLSGWREEADGTPDVDAMPDRLVDALRDAIARLVEHRLTAPERGVVSESRGGRSRSYASRSSGVPPPVYAPLRPFDDRTPWH